MARATVGVLVKFTPEEVAAIDAARGTYPRTVWIKEACGRRVVELAAEPRVMANGRVWRRARLVDVPRVDRSALGPASD
jgi:hypothetical protein